MVLWYNKRVSYLDGLPEVVSPPLLVDDMLVDLAGGDVVVTVEGHIQEPVVVEVVRLIQVCCRKSHNQTLH